MTTINCAAGMHHNCLVSAWEEEVGKGGANGKGGYQASDVPVDLLLSGCALATPKGSTVYRIHCFLT